MEKRWRGEGGREDPGMGTVMIFLIGQPKLVLTEQTPDEIKGSSCVIWGRAGGRGKSPGRANSISDLRGSSCLKNSRGVSPAAADSLWEKVERGGSGRQPGARGQLC